MAGNKKTVNLLPENLRTTKNSKFLSSTIDPLISSPELERVDGYVGSKITPNFNPTKDFYLPSKSELRKNYELEPALVFKNDTNLINDVIAYDDIINELSNYGADTTNLSKLFQSSYYSYDPLINWDKFINFLYYYWLPTGPDTILIDQCLLNVDSEIIGKTEYTMPNGYKLSNGMKIKFLNDVIPSTYFEKEFIVEGVGESIQLIDFSLLRANENLSNVYDEKFDSDKFDILPFDGDRKLPITPEYVTINKSSLDLNSWTRYNRWFHKDVIEISAKLNNKIPVFDYNARAKRPIIEFKPNIQLYNFGRKGIRNVDLFDSTTLNAFNVVNRSYGYYVDGVMLEHGHRVIFNADLDPDVKGKIYRVELNVTGDVPIINLIPAEDFEPNHLDSLSVNYGKTYAGKTFYYSLENKEWIYAQQHEKLNEAPLFDLVDENQTSYTKIADKNNFKGNKIFGYELGNTFDNVLGFKIKQENSVGIGSYVFRNYFMSDIISKTVNGVSNDISTGVAFIKINNLDGTSKLVNVWNKSDKPFEIPVIETQIVTDTTTTLSINSLDIPNFSSVNVYVNNSRREVSVTTGSNILNFVEPTTLVPNDTITIKLITDQKPNSNGYYQTPISLTNNPLNNPITQLTFSELSDHLRTMVENIPNFEGVFPGSSNLRDLSNFEKYGTRLLINENPIAFTKFFLGKKSHNVVDSLRSTAQHYNQFKMNLLKLAVSLTEQLNPANALDEILTTVNKGKDLNSLYYRSDMIGYGPSKFVKTYKVADIEIKEYFTGRDFLLDNLSFQSLLVYLNDELLIVDKDYVINYFNQTVEILSDLDLNDTITIVFYDNTQGCYVPPTPTKLGLYPKFVPEKYIDNSYVNGPVSMIRGHDGSLMKAYNDYRDDIILEFEKRVYNNIKIKYRSDIFDVLITEDGAFRNNKSNVNNILAHDFLIWAGQYGIDYTKNSTFDQGNQFTWNFAETIDTLFGKKLRGTWRNIFKYFYDTDAPNICPWEMLGISVEPKWWKDVYGPAPYTSGNITLWTDLQNGLVSDPDGAYILDQYKRPGLLDIIPVDDKGKLKDPTSFIVTDNSYFDKSSSWKFGDHSPAETAWRKSSFYPYALNIAAAIVRPLEYLSLMYDPSRITFNVLNQIIYTEDSLFLDLRKLVIDDQKQTAGFSVLICEHGKQKYQNYLNVLKQDLLYLNFNLFHKLGGFASKEKLQINIDSIDPISRSPGVILPPEDYTLLLNVSNPVKEINISGIIVQKSNGKYIIKGYDKTKPYFNILEPIKGATSGAVVIGGVSEEFTEWSNASNETNKNLTSFDLTTANSVTTRYYKQGQIVRYNGVFYRTKVSHTAQDAFNTALFQQLPSLPVKGGARAQLPSRYSSSVTSIPYGSEFNTVQEVFDIILGYGAWLESQGFVFDSFNTDLNDVINWKFSGKEFLYWSTQNWSDNNLITLSPFSDYLKFQSNDSVVDNIVSDEYGYNLLKADGTLYPKDKFNFSREDGYCIIQTLDDYEGIFFASLRTVQKEHGMVFNNSTIFNDTIYDIETGYKQQRVKLSGFRTKNWNGDFFSPGFVYDSVNINEWEQYKTYNPGDVVRFKSLYYQAIKKIEGSLEFNFSEWARLNGKPNSDLIPNFDYKINQFEDFYSLDIDNFDYSQQQLAQHLVGYTPRTYLNNIFSNPISQYKFYQGYIKEKGTKKSIDKLSKAAEYNRQGSIEINEEWAFRVGHYGSYSSYDELEFNLEEGSGLENPYLIKLVDNIPTDPNPLINYVGKSDILISPEFYVTTSTFSTYDGTYEDTNFELTSAGYVRFDDVTATAYNKNSLLDIANNSLINNGDTIWVGFLENGGWDVYRYSRQIARITGVFVSAPGSEITFVTNEPHELKIGDIVSVSRFNQQVNGVYIVNSIPKLNQFSVSSTLSTIVNEELVSLGIMYKFETARVNDINKLSTTVNLLNLQNGDKIWVDKDVDQKWKVYQKVDNYSSEEYNTVDLYGDQRFGSSIYANDSTPTVIISSPGKKILGDNSYGKVSVFRKVTNLLERQYEYGINDSNKIYCDQNLPTDFGHSISYDENKSLFIIGSPAASYIRANSTTGTVILSTGSGIIKTFSNEGLVKVSSKKPFINQDVTEFVLVNPNAVTTTTAENSRFGHSLYTNQPLSNTSTLLLVSAPGIPGYSGPGSVYAYWINTVTNTVTNVTSATIQVNPFTFAVTATTTLNSGSRWGHKIVGNRTGTRIAISAPGYKSTSSNTIGLVEIFRNTRPVFSNTMTRSQVILPLPEYSYNGFGDDLAMSDSGNILLVSSVNAVTQSGSKGKVFVYSASSTGTYSLVQVIDNPIRDTNLKFGHSISISGDESTISISSLGTNRSKVTRFLEDPSDPTNETTFDGNTTMFVSSVPDSGMVYVFDKIGDKYVFSSKLDDVNILEGSKYGMSARITNDSVFVGAPLFSSNILTPDLLPDNSKVYQFNKIDTKIGGYKILRQQEPTVEINKVKRIALIDSFKEEIIDYLDVVDPIKGKITGIAEQELKYKLASDPAVYSIGIPITNIDTETNWLDDHVGELWWDLSTVKYVWYEQGDDIYRKNNWGRVFPGSGIDVYEWVKSDLLPSEWAIQADTNEGLTKGISGQPKYPDNSVLSVKQVYNNITGTLENVYYFWVKNKVLLPSATNRRISAYQVSFLISDPTANNIKFAEILNSDALALANVQPTLVSNRINANIVIDKIENNIPRHTEWLLLEEGNKNSLPNTLLEKKLFDSLLGRDSFGNLVPDLSLTYRNRYGLGIRPQQTLFKNRIEALRNVIEFANDILIKNRITGNYDFINLNKQEEIPDTSSREYDIVVDTNIELDTLSTTYYKRAKIECTVFNGKIRAVNIIEPGFGYINPPTVSILSDTGINGEIKLTINSVGSVDSVSIINSGDKYTIPPTLIVRPHTVIVKTDSTAGNRWTKNEFNYSTSNNESKWLKVKTQSYNTPIYWEYVDWVSDNYNQFKNLSYFVNDIAEADSIIDINTGDYVKVKNSGSGNYIILEKVDNNIIGDFTANYNIVYSEKGTIQIKEIIWNYDAAKYAYDILTLDETLYDQIPDLEIYYILLALKENIFVNKLKVNWNLLFFKAVKYALSEQKLLDWAFKTSFITVKNTIGNLDQRSVYKLDNDQYFEKYIDEVKPYHTKIRSYTGAFNSLDLANVQVNDFDLPSYYDSENLQYRTIEINSNVPKSIFTVTNELVNQLPWKMWANNYTYNVVDVLVGNPGKGYTEIPLVTISPPTTVNGTTATANAYLRNGSIYKFVVTNPGSGYVSQPTITITGGGSYVTSTATASVILGNNLIRKNTIGIKFDRTTLVDEISNDSITDTFVCDGKTMEFPLSWSAKYNKEDIIPRLDGIPVLSVDYTIDYKNNKSRDCVFRFLNYVPVEGQVFKVTYNKNMTLFNAVERINSYYQPTESMPGKKLPLLMNGAEYKNTVIQGLPFKYASPWSKENTKYGEFVWDDLITQYASAKLISTASVGTSTLFLSTTTDIKPGQTISILSSSTVRVRENTVVVSVSTVSNSITISNPVYQIKTAKALGVNAGSDIIVRTTIPFNKTLLAGDIITLTGISPIEFNDQYIITRIDDNDTFVVTASSILSTSTVVSLTSATAKVSSILTDIEPGSVIIDTIVTTVTNTSSTVISTFLNEDKISKFVVSVNSIAITNNTATNPHYVLTTDLDSGNKAIVTINGLTTTSTVKVQMFEDPKIEFWKTTTLASAIDTDLSGGTWSGTNFVGALGVNPDEIIVEGEKLLSVNSGFGPEELVPGHVLDSIGINVYTKTKKSNALIMTGTLLSSTSSTSTYTLSVDPNPVGFGLMVYGQNKIFNRVNDTNFTATNQYYLYGTEITIPPQNNWERVGYTMMTLGGENLLDSRFITVDNTTTAIVESLASIIDVNSVYVVVNEQEIQPITTTSNYGYVLESVSDENNRASVKIYNLTTGTNNIKVWFFNAYFDTFNRVHEEFFNITSTSSITLSVPPGLIKPENAQAIVEVGANNSNTRKRIMPPWISYYQVDNYQVNFRIDNKNLRPAGYYNKNEVKAYINGKELILDFDYTVNTTTSVISLSAGIAKNGDVVAVMGVKDYDYNITGNTLTFSSIINDSVVKVITFTNHDDLLIHTEKFNPIPINRYTLAREVLDDSYVWVYLNGIPLIHRYDFEILSDRRTIQLNEWINTSGTDTVLITTFADPSANNQLIGYRIFKDIFDRTSFRRLAKQYSTFLTKELKPLDTEIHVDNSDNLVTPDPRLNKPGVIIIDGERIEFFEKSGNILRKLRRSTMGTGPARVSQAGTRVIDQSIREMVPYMENTYVQRILTTGTNTYVISTVTSTATGDGITLTQGISAVDQLEVYYGGNQLRKTSLVVHDLAVSYNDTPASLRTFPAEFSVNTLTQELVINLQDSITTGTEITIIQKKGTIWTGTESLLTSKVTQAEFLRNKQSVLPDVYYYGGNRYLLDESYFTFNDENDSALEE